MILELMEMAGLFRQSSELGGGGGGVRWGDFSTIVWLAITVKNSGVGHFGWPSGFITSTEAFGEKNFKGSAYYCEL